MTIREMHHLFRTIGQAKGLQLVRAILPDSIDDYLNSAILEKCRSVLIQNTSTQFQDKVTTVDNPISPYNALRTLFREEMFTPTLRPINEYYRVTRSTHKNEVLAYIGVAVEYGGRKDVKRNGKTIPNVLYSSNPRRYPCRIIEPDKIYHILNDFCSAPSKEYPCCVIDGSNGVNRPIDFQIYTGGNSIYQVYISWIDMPAKVFANYENKINPTTNEPYKDVDCDLPDYLHSEIVEIAVNKYFQSVGSTTKQVN